MSELISVYVTLENNNIEYNIKMKTIIKSSENISYLRQTILKVLSLSKKKLKILVKNRGSLNNLSLNEHFRQIICVTGLSSGKDYASYSECAVT